ncbi:putative CONSERVED INTEGRAL MEMBRANE PROTEIN [Pseudonocardia sp. Ae168_Ps1]|uniref:decaprenyl-phosphate phosphoribosyltransferase n=1 Tax=unclassified Pseudonocardia TaxID=2619320 RepID=UPI00094B32E3|nr:MULTISPECIES: decaprenyl-phosphate phosphoribosyltransferase [unclassified Pseudonocardia]OLL75185.1 putative CONSERVED INTEGRAL MEMBRANE PROTEIN [Pseudonocardia sp. Ae150A_Ps1]OLL81179.1 putative CONSERVED INTEGRAL MEMBRANE PROTEIN [Pseudonocardia sp. Ae168_Ps1]OLL84706.1 putative CONSERVED INTEGRAL MEMBRANE PROTEIN [Pseudonocardia sp. Ae263_Ps1]OLL95277.1 putative CONSERVED INTEGRAL MEMBRANE PROTEIN [Pseudonocardia sp. Ae356_Ps1]
MTSTDPTKVDRTDRDDEGSPSSSNGSSGTDGSKGTAASADGSGTPSKAAVAEAADPTTPVEPDAPDDAGTPEGHEADAAGGTPAPHVPLDPSERTTAMVARGLLKTMRPRQWVKNVLVFAAPFVGGGLFGVEVLIDCLIAFVAFSLAASGVYLVNDALDVEADRAHPTKRRRPIAAGIVPVPLAYAASAVLFAAAIVLSILSTWQLIVVLAVYVAVQLSYCLWLKHQPVLDICIVASGFLMRSIAGGVATEIPLSQWFLLVTGFGSLFMVAGKRYAEMRLAEDTGAKIRKSLESYSASYLRYIWSLSATVMIMTYGLWAFEIREAHHNTVWSVLSIVPFVIAVLRYSVDVDKGSGGEPEEIALGDRALQVLAVAWIAMLTLAVYS